MDRYWRLLRYWRGWCCAQSYLHIKDHTSNTLVYLCRKARLGPSPPGKWLSSRLGLFGRILGKDVHEEHEQRYCYRLVMNLFLTHRCASSTCGTAAYSAALIPSTIVAAAFMFSAASFLCFICASSAGEGAGAVLNRDAGCLCEGGPGAGAWEAALKAWACSGGRRLTVDLGLRAGGWPGELACRAGAAFASPAAAVAAATLPSAALSA